MGEIYPDGEITEDFVKIGDAVIPTANIEGPVKIMGGNGYCHRITLTVFVEDLTIRSGAPFEGVPG